VGGQGVGGGPPKQNFLPWVWGNLLLWVRFQQTKKTTFFFDRTKPGKNRGVQVTKPPIFVLCLWMFWLVLPLLGAQKKNLWFQGGGGLGFSPIFFFSQPTLGFVALLFLPSWGKPGKNLFFFGGRRGLLLGPPFCGVGDFFFCIFFLNFSLFFSYCPPPPGVLFLEKRGEW